MYLTPTANHWAVDIEADDLLEKATQIWCACVENCVTGEKETMIDGEGWRRWLAAHPEAILVGHNFLAYDLVMLNRFWGSRHPVRLVVDTFVLSQVYNPSYPRPAGMTGKKGPHSLEAWGIRLRHPKTEFHDFSARTKRMIRYCENDVSLTRKLFVKLAERMLATGFSESGLELEHLSWAIIQNKQRRNGFPFNYRAAHELYVTLIARQEELQNEIYKLWPPQFRVVASYKQARKKDGSYTKGYELHSGQFPKLVDRPDGGYDAYDWVAFNLGSPTQRIEKLLELGWQPVNFTKKTAKGGGGNPQVDEESLIAYAELSGNPEILALAKWIVCNARGNMIRTWLDAYNEETGAIHGKLFIASTLRYRHRDPNSANIPAVREGKDADGKDYILYGEDGAWAYECRDLWNCGAPSEWSLVGIDGTGIQNRCLIHALIGTVGEEAVREFKELGLSGDIHKHNIKVLGLANKPAAKKFYYCVPMQATALTKKGWKGYNDIEEGDLVLTFNAEKRIQEWKPVLEKVYFDDAPVIEMSHRNGFKIASTPNHRWFVQQRKTRTRWTETPVEVRTTEEITTMQNIVVNAELVDDSPPSEVDWASLDKWNTDWEQVVLDMSQQERKAFLSGFLIADGHMRKYGRWSWGQLRGNLFEAALLASYLVSDSFIHVSTRQQANGVMFGTCNIGLKPHITTAFIEKRQLENQPVWCIRTENESWVMRQGDTITITGNTLMMGGRGARLAADQVQFGTRMTAQEGNEKRERMIASIPGFQLLIDKLERERDKTGRIKLCDGTPILVPSPHMVIPYLLQGDESRLMKKALTYVDQEIRLKGLQEHCRKVADIHDEWQWQVRNQYVQQFIDLALPCFPRAGEFFNYKIKIEGDAKVGKTWSQTH